MKDSNEVSGCSSCLAFAGEIRVMSKKLEIVNNDLLSFRITMLGLLDNGLYSDAVDFLEGLSNGQESES